MFIETFKAVSKYNIKYKLHQLLIRNIDCLEESEIDFCDKRGVHIIQHLLDIGLTELALKVISKILEKNPHNENAKKYNAQINGADDSIEAFARSIIELEFDSACDFRGKIAQNIDLTQDNLASQAIYHVMDCMIRHKIDGEEYQYRKLKEGFFKLLGSVNKVIAI